MQKDSITRRLYKFLADHWFVSTLMITFPMILDHLHTYSEKNTLISAELSMGLIVFFTLVTLVRNVGISLDEKKRIATGGYYNYLSEVLNKNTSKRMEDIIEIIEGGEYQGVVDTVISPYENPSSRLNPQKKIKEYCKNTQEILEQSFGAARDDIVITVFYKNIVDYGTDVDWDVLYSTYNVNDISSSSIKRNSNSSFNQVKDKSDALFFMNKKNAYMEFHYMQTEMEEREGLDQLNGTIYCHNISITNRTGTVILPLVICIASLKEPLCNDVDYYARKKAEKLFSIIEENIRYEVATMLLYGQMGMSNLFRGPDTKNEDGEQNDPDADINKIDLEGGTE